MFNVVAYSRSNSGAELTRLVVPLTGDYRQAMESCARLQSSGDDGTFSAVEEGLDIAHQHLQTPDNGGDGRESSKKLVFLVSGSRPDSYQCSTCDVNNHIARHNDGNFYHDGTYEKDGALVQASKMRLESWQVSTIGIGAEVDVDFLTRASRVSLKGKDQPYLRFVSSPDEYEQVLKQAVLDSQTTRVSLVQ
jgi:hypothetical protein